MCCKFSMVEKAIVLRAKVNALTGIPESLCWPLLPHHSLLGSVSVPVTGTLLFLQCLWSALSGKNLLPCPFSLEYSYIRHTRASSIFIVTTKHLTKEAYGRMSSFGSQSTMSGRSRQQGPGAAGHAACSQAAKGADCCDFACFLFFPVLYSV